MKHGVIFVDPDDGPIANGLVYFELVGGTPIIAGQVVGNPETLDDEGTLWRDWRQIMGRIERVEDSNGNHVSKFGVLEVYEAGEER